MLGSIGMPELIIIFIIALIIFGPRKLPELGRSLGKSLGMILRIKFAKSPLSTLLVTKRFPRCARVAPRLPTSRF